MFSLAQKKSNVGDLRKTADKFLDEIPRVQALEVTLGLPDDV